MRSKVLNIYFAKNYTTLVRSDKSRYKDIQEKESRKEVR